MSKRPWGTAALLLVILLAGCTVPDVDQGPTTPPYTLTVHTRYGPDASQPPAGFEAARLPEDSVATPPMFVQITVDNAFDPVKGRYPEEARTGWRYHTACPQVRQHATDREQDNVCDGHPARSRFVLPPLYPADRMLNYSHLHTPDSYGYSDYSAAWLGRGYYFGTQNHSQHWNYTRFFSAHVPVDRNGTIQFVFNHRTPLQVRLTAAQGEIPEAMDDDVVQPENCTSDDGPTDYVLGSLPEVVSASGAVDPFEGSYQAEPDDRYSAFKGWIQGDAEVTMEWRALCFREDEGGVA